jgi:hypothetical protein
MNDEQYKKIELAFRNSTSGDELFDSFGEALKSNILDFDLYKILLANPSLTTDEIKMYTEKLLRVAEQNSYQILMWTGKIFESRSNSFMHPEEPINYYERAIKAQPAECDPLINLLKLFNYEVETESNKKILSLIEKHIEGIYTKSRVYYALSNLYKRCGNITVSSKYMALAEKAAESERKNLSNNILL